MSEIIVMPDAEQVVIDYLTAALAARGEIIPVGTRLDRMPELPGRRPSESVLIKRIGGAGHPTKRTDKPWVLIDTRAATETRAERIGALVSALLFAAEGETVDGCFIYSVGQLTGLTNDPDVLTQTPRYTQTMSLHIAGQILP